MNISYFKNKKYEIPLNVPKSKVHTYMEVIAKGYAKYLDIINLCDRFIMYKQFYKLVELFEGQYRTVGSNKTIAKGKIIPDLKRLGFIETEHINSNKFIYLRKPAIAIADGDYLSNGRVNINRDMKNDKFKISILKVEHFLNSGEIFHSSNMMEQLKIITKDILQLIQENNNQYGYDIDTINQILKMNDYINIRNFLDNKPEYLCKLDIIRSLWTNLGMLFRKLMLQRQTVSEQPKYLKYFVTSHGQVILHYIPTIIIFDVNYDVSYYKDKSLKLFNTFYNIPNNELRYIQKNYIESNNKTMGYEGTHHIGYTFLLVGADKDVLQEKKIAIDENFNKSINSPLMSPAQLEYLNIGDYLYHASRKGNKYSKKHDERIDRLILNKLKTLDLLDRGKINRSNSDKDVCKENIESIESSRKSNNSIGQEILELIEG